MCARGADEEDDDGADNADDDDVPPPPPPLLPSLPAFSSVASFPLLPSLPAFSSVASFVARYVIIAGTTEQYHTNKQITEMRQRETDNKHTW